MQEPPPAAYLRAAGELSAGEGVQLAVTLNGNVVSRTGFRGISTGPFAQQAGGHDGGNRRRHTPVDLFASGAGVGEWPSAWGSLMELSWGGSRSLRLGERLDAARF